MAPNMAPNVAPNVEKDKAFQNVTPIDTELQSVDKSSAENVTPIVTPDKAALKIKNNHARRRKRFRFFIAPESNERKMLW